jgi:phenylalanyl-tRNA synthetase alpha chain
LPTPDLDAVVAAGRQAIADATDLDSLRQAEQAHLARRSPLGEVQRSLGGLDEAARRDLGRRVNQARSALQAELAARRAELEAERDKALLEAERVDVTLPGRVPPRGAVHPVTRTTDEIVDIFIGLGYRVAEGPEVETDWYNFEALNIPPDHPARSMQDSLYMAATDGREAG